MIFVNPTFNNINLMETIKKMNPWWENVKWHELDSDYNDRVRKSPFIHRWFWIKKLKITGELVETVRREISEIDPEYRSLFKEQLNMIASWNTKDKKVLEQLLDKTHHGKIKFSKSTTYWMG